jgi:hypothetical protein
LIDVGAVTVSSHVEPMGALSSEVTVAVFEIVPDASGMTRTLIVAVLVAPVAAIVPSGHVTCPPASEHVPSVLVA